MPQRRRIVLLFGLGIVLPSLLLAYFAFRGIQNDRALVEKERLERTRRAAQEAVRSVDAAIEKVESALEAEVAGLPDASAPASRAAAEKLAGENPLIEEVFVLEDLATVCFPGAHLLYVRDGHRGRDASPNPGPADSAEVRAGQRLEFQERDYRGALAAYRQALAGSSDPGLKGLILNAMARVEKKSGLLREAITTYERIRRDHGGTVMPGGMPLGPSAVLEICGLAAELEDWARCLQSSIGLYRSLLRREWDLEKAEFEFFAERAKAIIEPALTGAPAGPDLAASRTDFQALRDEETAARRRTERALAFKEGAAPALMTRAATAEGTPADGRFSRSSLNMEPEVYLVSIQRIAGRTAEAPVSPWGVILNADRLRDDVLRPALNARFSPGTTVWALKGRDGAVLGSSGPAAAGPGAYRANFPSDFPDWTLEFQQPSSPLIKSFLLSRRGLYSFVFLLIAGILIFGLALTLRSVSHELELARMKSDFVSTVSHEFKSPLTSIRQLAEMLQAGRVPSEERRQKYYDVLLEQSERLTLLTDNILSLARIEEGRAEFRFETTDIAALLAEVVASFQERVRHEGFAVGLEVDHGLPSLAVDRTALSQAVTNLVDNAVKYSGDSREISVRAFVQGPFLTIAVRDRGVGIKAEDLDRVFERFYRAGDGLTRTVKGSGLGLTLVKEIVAAHRGEVRVESEPGKGSVFSIRLPLAPVKEGRP